jgi:proliferating cell nuclear antigen
MGKRILEIQTIQSNVVKVLCDVLKETLNDVNFVFDSEGMRVMAMDGSQVALVHLKLYADRFEYFKCEQTFHVGLNMLNLFKLIKTVTNMDSLTFYIDDDNPNEFGIRIENADRNSHTTFNLKMLDIDEAEIRIPDIQLDSVITMPSNDFQRICRDMYHIADYIEISTSDHMLKLSCSGDFASQETLIGEASHGLVFSRTNEDEDITGKFSLKYINLFTKSTNLSNNLQIFLKKGYPFMLKYNVANLGDIMFCLAPSA